MADNTTLNLGTLGDVVRDIDKGGIKTQVVALDIGGSGTESLVTLTNPHPIMAAATNFFFSPTTGGNSSTTQLASAASFIGTVESIQSQQTISILLTSDQPGVLHLIQYIDAGGTKVASDWTETIAANVPFSEAYTANGNYFKATFINNGASTTTTFNLNVAYGTLPAVTTLGNGQVSLNEVNGSNFTLGQKTMTNSLPIVIASDQSAVSIQDLMTATTYNVAGVIAINTVLATIDLISDAAVSVQCTSMGTTGVVTPEWSNDNVTWIAATNLVTQAGVPIATFSAAGLWTAQVCARYLRLRLSTATTAGTTTIVVYAASQPLGASQAQTVVQPTAANLTCTASIAAAQTLATVTTVGTVTTCSTVTTVGNVSASTAAASALTSLNVNATGALVQVKASAGNLFGLSFFNGTAAVVYLSFWNLLSASVTLGTTAPTCVFALPASSTLTVPSGMFGLMAQSTGISFAAVTTYNGATTASVTGSIYFK